LVNLEAEQELNLLQAGYWPTEGAMIEEGCRLALVKTDPYLEREEHEKWRSLIAPFVYFDRMDRDLNPQSDRYRFRARQK
jgi:hypothetical protein